MFQGSSKGMCGYWWSQQRIDIPYDISYEHIYACGKLDHTKGMFVGYKWTRITVAEMYWFLGILLKMTLISSDINGFKSLWYPPTHALISPSCQYVIKDYPSWIKHYMSYSRFVQIRVTFHPENGTSQGRDICHQLRIGINHLFRQPSMHSIQRRKCPLMRVLSQANKIIILSDNIKITNQISIVLTFLLLLMHPVDTISSITLMSIREKMNKTLEYQKMFGIFLQHKKRLWMQ